MIVELLYVEDDEDLRRLIGLLLSNEGYAVTAVATAEDAIVELKKKRYQLLLTDYNLPNENADWLVKVAQASGALRETGVVILTATERPEGVEPYRVLRKPVDIAVLFAALDEAAGAGLPLAAGAGASAGPIQLALYITGGSRESKKALRNLNRVLDTIDRSKVRLDVCDVAGGVRPSAESLDEDRIVVTPTLVRKFPLPKVWIYGDLSKPDILEEMIAAGLDGLESANGRAAAG